MSETIDVKARMHELVAWCRSNGVRTNCLTHEDVRTAALATLWMERVRGDEDEEVYDRMVAGARDDAERFRVEREMREALAGAWKIGTPMGGRTTATESAMHAPAPAAPSTEFLVCPKAGTCLYGKSDQCRHAKLHERNAMCKGGIVELKGACPECVVVSAEKGGGGDRLPDVAPTVYVKFVLTPIEGGGCDAPNTPPAWISVKNRLPDVAPTECGRWIVTDGKVVYVTCEHPKRWVTSGCEGMIGAVVTHWMPIYTGVER